jgi:hypothetical protein
MAWNDTIDEDTEWQNIDFIEMFWKAVNERRAVRFITATTITSADVAVPVAGSEIQGGTSDFVIWSATQISITRSGSVATVKPNTTERTPY